MASPPRWFIREAKPEDAKDVVRMARALAKHEGSSSTFTQAEYLRHCVGEERAIHVLVAEAVSASEASAEAVAFLMYYPGYDLATAARGNHLGDMYVDEAWRKRGVGRALFAELSRLTLAEGGKWISWTVLKMNEAAHEFYKSLNAVQVGVDFMAIGELGLRGLLKHRAA